jgi:Flp pilus assembly pilin Flp
MGLCVPGIAWIERSALLVVLIIIAIIAIGFALWSRLRGLWHRPAEP